MNNNQTPYFLYDLNLLEQTVNAAKLAADKRNYEIHYALKANANLPVLDVIKKAGLGIDCVSENELRLALDRKFDPRSIMIAGVGKSDKELELAIENEICSINCESIEELLIIDELACVLSKPKVNISLRINPDVDARTHPNITTGKKYNKFGIEEALIDKAIDICNRSSYLNLIGIHLHIGSQIIDMNAYAELCQKANELVERFLNSGVELSILNLGGGLGINYDEPDDELIPDFEKYFSVIEENLNIPSSIKVHFELGRSLVGQCGKLITKVMFVKDTSSSNIVVVDAGMTELIRPALYGSYHKIENLSSCLPSEDYQVVGPICETSDTFGNQVSLPKTKRGDILTIRSVGAYGEVMSSKYNLREPKPSVYQN